MMNSISVLSRACGRCTSTIKSTPSIPSRISQSRYLSQTSSIQSSLTAGQTSSTSTAPLPPPEPFSSPSKPTQNPTQPKLLTGTITRTGTMQSCIQITHHAQKYDTHLQKHYTRPTRLLVHDPNPTGYLREGDVIEYSTWSSDEKQARLQRKADVLANPEAHETQKKRTGRRFMTAKKARGNHGTGAEKWVGPRYVFRRVVTPFGTRLDRRMDEVVKKVEAEAGRVEEVQSKGRRGSVAQNAKSAKVAG